MPFEYSAQNHDWDLTLYAAAELIRVGLVMDKRPKTGSLSMGFSFFTGGMVLSFAAIESFSASLAFVMQSDARFPGFDFGRFRSAKRFWEKVEMLTTACGVEIDKGKGLFQQIGQMQEWRNLVAHSSPYEIESTIIQNSTTEPGKLHGPNRRLEYTRMVDPETAARFYKNAVQYIELLQAKTNLNPRASASYRILPDTEQSDGSLKADGKGDA